MDEVTTPDLHDVVFRVVQVEEVAYDFWSASAAVVLREAEGVRRVLSLPVALNDATAIHQAWQHVAGRRPATNELVVFILQELQADVIAARIVRMDAGVYYGELDLMTKQGRRVFDCRPSDAIALALRQVVPAPLLVAEELLNPV
jgi:bifunctional DNase/RNase